MKTELLWKRESGGSGGFVIVEVENFKEEGKCLVQDYDGKGALEL